MDPKETERLHEQASGYYLQGDLDSALNVWSGLLEADPDDERAAEGIRLCEQLIGSHSESVCSEGESPFAVGGAGIPPETKADPVTAPEVDEALEGLLDFGVPAAASDPRGPEAGTLDLSDLSDEGTQTGGFDDEKLMLAPAARAGDAEPEVECGPAKVWDFGYLEEAEPPPRKDEWSFGASPPPPPAQRSASPPVPTAPPASAEPELGPAEAELRRRANELLAGALKAAESGDRDEAIRTVERVLILDEANEAALSLKERLDAGDDFSPAAEPPASFSAPDPGVGFDAEPEGTDDDILPLDPRVVPLRDESAPPDDDLFADADTASDEIDAPLDEAPIAPGFLDEDLPSIEDLVGPDPDAPEELPTDAPSSPPVAAAGRGRKRGILLGVGLLAAGAAGAFFLQGMLSGGAATDPADSLTLPTRGGKEEPRAEVREAAEPETGMELRSAEERVAAALAEADASIAAGDLASAVIALDEALKLDPDDPELAQRFRTTADRYRVEQKEREHWAEAIASFDAGNYRAALSVFYRAPESRQGPELERYKLNGWYNLAVRALGSGDCERAQAHLREARGVDATDPDVRHASALANRCGTAGGAAAWAAAVRELNLRRLED